VHLYVFAHNLKATGPLVTRLALFACIDDYSDCMNGLLMLSPDGFLQHSKYE
jgi:hypothetical protein